MISDQPEDTRCTPVDVMVIMLTCSIAAVLAFSAWAWWISMRPPAPEPPAAVYASDETGRSP